MFTYLDVYVCEFCCSLFFLSANECVSMFEHLYYEWLVSTSCQLGQISLQQTHTYKIDPS